jgi:ATP-dependent Lhr-like helicase
VVPDADGVWRVPDARLARRHRSNIGTIVSDAAMSVQFLTGGRIATVEESFIARLRAGDVFLLGGRTLELVRTEGLTAYVRLARAAGPCCRAGPAASCPSPTPWPRPCWNAWPPPRAARRPMPRCRRCSPAAAAGRLVGPAHARDPAGRDAALARRPPPLPLPLAGRTVHLGLASLLAWRLARETPATFTMAVNDYGLELLSATPMDWATVLPRALAPAEPAALREEVRASLNAGELARRRFREIARISGLIFQSHPGEARSQRQLQASASLYYEVFRQHDPGNRLLQQAEDELLSQELAVDRLDHSLRTLQQRRLQLQVLARPSPLALPLMVDRLRERLSTEQLGQRLARMLAELEAAAGGEAPTDLAERLGFSTEASAAAPRGRRSRARHRPRTRPRP